MDSSQFAATLGAVIAGNTLTLLFVRALWEAGKAEREGRPTTSLPPYVYIMGILGPLIGASGVFFFVS